ncbi:MAG TPA: phosphotransferase, partial [Deinococcales bacterium]|nr:phosphotransferase [Deinococcales bacterium]
GFPAPRPLAPPAALPGGSATFEQYLDAGSPADPRDPAQRDRMARSLARLVRLCQPFVERDALEAWMVPQRGELWPEPHDRRFDFPATVRGAEWIDAVAARALATLADPRGQAVVGHNDWRREHLRFQQGVLSAVHDWDSLGRFPEPVLVAGAARTYPADWTLEGHRQYPTLEEMRAFVRSYEVERGTPFTPGEHRTLWAAVAYGAAYTARCEHSDDRTGYGNGPLVPTPAAIPAGSMRGFLLAHADELL